MLGSNCWGLYFTLPYPSGSLCSSTHHLTAPLSSTVVYSPQPYCQTANKQIIHTLSTQSRGHLAGAPWRRTPATNHRPTRRGPGLAPGATRPQWLRRRTLAANHRHARLTPPDVGPHRRRHAAAAAGNAAAWPGSQPAGPAQQRSVATSSPTVLNHRTTH